MPHFPGAEGNYDLFIVGEEATVLSPFNTPHSLLLLVYCLYCFNALCLHIYEHIFTSFHYIF